jgi:hypothetical protein
LRAGQEVVPPDAPLEIVDLEGIPPFNEDDESTLPTRAIGPKMWIREAGAAGPILLDRRRHVLRSYRVRRNA